MRFDHTIFEPWEWVALAILAAGLVVGAVVASPLLEACAAAGACFLALRALSRRKKDRAGVDDDGP